MELNKDLVRNLLLNLEDKKTDSSMSQKEIDDFAETQNISTKQMIYTIQRLEEAGFIKISIQYASNKPYWYHISSITYEGHQFLDNIRDPKVWKITKEKVSQITGVSLPIIGQVASAYIKSQLGL